MNIILSNTLACTGIPRDLESELWSRLTFPNPKWIENRRMGHWNGQTPRFLQCFKEAGEGLILPRGYINHLLSLCRERGVSYRVSDRRRTLLDINFEFRGTLKGSQEEAVETILTQDFGTLSAPTGSGKTVMALAAIAERRQPTLIVTHTRELLNQWVSRIGTFLGIPAEEIGVIGNGKRTLGRKITVALVQSLYKCSDQVTAYIGFVVVDECHRAPSRTFTEAVSAFDCKFMLGLSATPWRRDGLSKLIFWYVGDVVHEVRKEELIESGDVLRADVVSRETKFQTSFDPSEEYSRMLSELTEDVDRNCLIARDVISQARNGRGVCLVLSDRKAHCLVLEELIERLPGGLQAEVLTGDVSAKERQDIVERLNDGQVKILVATGQLVGEGFDCRELSTLFLATPIRFDGRVLQYLGRVLRPAPGKAQAKVFDYVDSKVGVLKAAANARRRVYANS